MLSVPQRARAVSKMKVKLRIYLAFLHYLCLCVFRVRASPTNIAAQQSAGKIITGSTCSGSLRIVQTIHAVQISAPTKIRLRMIFPSNMSKTSFVFSASSMPQLLRTVHQKPWVNAVKALGQEKNSPERSCCDQSYLLRMKSMSLPTKSSAQTRALSANSGCQAQ